MPIQPEKGELTHAPLELVPPLPDIERALEPIPESGNGQVIPVQERTKPPEERGSRVKRFLGKAAVWAAVTVSGGTFGLLFTHADTTLATQDAGVELTADNRITVDTGALGKIIKPSDLPAGLGAHIVVKDLHGEKGNSGFGNSADLTAKDAETYLNFLTTYKNDINKGKNALWEQWLLWAVIGDIAFVGLSIAGKEAKDRLGDEAKINRFIERAHGSNVLRLMLAASLVGSLAVPISIQELRPAVVPNVSHAFDGTWLEGARVTGFMKVLVNRVGVEALNFIDTTSNFYEQGAKSAQEAYKSTPLLSANNNTKLIAFNVSQHCNDGEINSIFRAQVKQYNPSLILNGGDLPFLGTAAEDLCISTYASAAGDKPVVQSAGDHESNLSIKQAESHGFKELGGKIIEIGGLRILGDSSPRLALFGNRLGHRRNETEQEMGHRLAEIACNDPAGNIILLVNEPGAALESVQRGCVTLAMTGGDKPSIIDSSGVVYLVGGSAGGGAPGAVAVGPLQNNEYPAHEYMILLDKANSKVLATQENKLNVSGTDAKFTVGAIAYSQYASTAQGSKALYGK